MLYGYDRVLVAEAQESGDLMLSSVHEHVYVSPENHKTEMSGVVIYEGKDIKAWAKKQQITYPQALSRFKAILYGDNGKEYFIKK